MQSFLLPWYFVKDLDKGNIQMHTRDMFTCSFLFVKPWFEQV